MTITKEEEAWVKHKHAFSNEYRVKLTREEIEWIRMKKSEDTVSSVLALIVAVILIPVIIWALTHLDDVREWWMWLVKPWTVL